MVKKCIPTYSKETIVFCEYNARQKLGMILENKMIQKLELEKKIPTKKWSPKLMFLNEKKVRQFLTYKIDFERFLSLYIHEI